MKIYLVRHGETDWNRGEKLQGQSDVPLNEYGIQLARETAAALESVPFDLAFCSPLGRAVQTAEILIGSRDIPLCRDPRLMEMRFGVMEGVAFGDAKKDEKNPMYHFFHAPASYKPPEGAESFQQLYDRTAEFLKDRLLPAEHKYKNVLIAGHGAMNRSIINPLAGIDLAHFWQIRLPNCAVSLLSLENGKFSLLEESRIY